MRRHRLNHIEIGPVANAVQGQLQLLCQGRQKVDELEAEILFRVWYRLKYHPTHRPDYPVPITWGVISSHIGTETVPFLQSTRIVDKPEQPIEVSPTEKPNAPVLLSEAKQ